jgi:predicted ATPase
MSTTLLSARASAGRPESVILTPDRRLRVFVSSTLDLSDARAAARRSIESLQLTPVMFEAGARPHPPRALYAAYVEQSDVFVAIYSRRYGWTAPAMDVSGLEDEYDLSAGKPRLVYIERDVDREPALDVFLERVRDDGLSYRPFGSATELEDLVRGDLVVLLTERFHASGIRPPASRGPLPTPTTAIVGRVNEVSRTMDLLGRDDVRLVTLVGPGGIGKTRLAIEAADRSAAAFPGGTFFVSLESLHEPQLVAETIAASLDVATSDSYPPTAAMADLLRDRVALLVVDNFEQVAAGAVVITDLLASCPRLKALVTSRSALRVRGEHEVDVPPLSLPPDAMGRDAIRAFPATQLFVDTAQAVRPSLDVDSGSAAAIVEICRMLDGLPLAIELAAAMVRVLTPDQILERLRGAPMTVGLARRDMPDRHHNLAATIAWSHDLLDGPAKQLFAQLGAFRGGFSLDAVERICDTDGDVADSIASLVEQSLVRVATDLSGGPRFTLLGTIHRFASERLDELPACAEVRDRHARTFVEIAARVGGPGGRQPKGLDTVEADLDNVRQALEWLLDAGDTDRVANAVGESWWFWWTRGYVREGKRWAERCIESPGIGTDALAKALVGLGMLAMWSGDYDEAEPTLERAASAAREVGDVRSAGYADIGLGLLRALIASLAEGSALIRRGVEGLEQYGDDLGAATGLTALSWVQAVTRRFDENPHQLHEALERARALGSDVEIGLAEAALAQFELEAGDIAGALELIAASLDHLAAARHIGSTIMTLEVIAELGILTGNEPVGAVTTLGATSTIRAAMGTRVAPAAAERLQLLSETARDRMGDEFVTAFQRGSRMTFAEAVTHGHGVLGGVRSASV